MTMGNATDQEQLEKESPPKTSFKLPPLPLRDSVLPPAQILAKTHSREHTSRVACLRSLSNAPPVPPLPPNVHRLKPISPASRLPLTRDQVEVPIGLPSVYPVIRPCSYSLVSVGWFLADCPL